MPKPIERPSQRQRLPLKSDWKDHPLVVAALSVAGTATLFATVVMPLSNSVLNAKVEKLTEISATSVATAEELERTKRDLITARAALTQATTKAPLVNRSIYPVGLDDVVIGSTVDDLVKRLPSAKRPEDESSYFSVQFPDHGTFHGAAYYLDDKKPQRVRSILFHLRDDQVGGEAIQKYLRTNFGEPTKRRKRQDVLWMATLREWVSLEYTTSGSTLFLITKAGDVTVSSDWKDSGAQPK
jgi:hypothetical protein